MISIWKPYLWRFMLKEKRKIIYGPVLTFNVWTCMFLEREHSLWSYHFQASAPELLWTNHSIHRQRKSPQLGHSVRELDQAIYSTQPHMHQWCWWLPPMCLQIWYSTRVCASRHRPLSSFMVKRGVQDRPLKRIFISHPNLRSSSRTMRLCRLQPSSLGVETCQCHTYVWANSPCGGGLLGTKDTPEPIGAFWQWSEPFHMTIPCDLSGSRPPDSTTKFVLQSWHLRGNGGRSPAHAKGWQEWG